MPGPGAGTGAISQNQTPAITSRFGSQTPQRFLSPSQTIHHGASSHYGKQHGPHLFPASQTAAWQNPATIRVKASWGTGTLLGYPLIWDMPAWPCCLEHPWSGEQCHHQILALPPQSTHNTGLPTLEHRHRSTAPHTMFPAPCCPQAGLSDSVSPLFKGIYTPSFGQAVLVQGRREGAGCVCHIHTSVHPSNRPSQREGGRFAKQRKIPEQRHRVQEGPYMGMGTVLCFPADECAAALAPPQPPTGTRHPTSIVASTGRGFHHCSPTVFQAGWKFEGCTSWPGHKSCPPCYSSACLLLCHAHLKTPQKLPGVPTYTPVPPSPYPHHTHGTTWHPTLISSSTTLYTPPTPPSLPTPIYLRSI